MTPGEKVKYVRENLDIPDARLAKDIRDSRFYVQCIREVVNNPDLQRQDKSE